MKKNDVNIDVKLKLAAERIKTKGKKRAEKHSEKHKFTEYKVGDLVLIRANYVSDAGSKVLSKFLAVYEGPYRLKEKRFNNSFVLENPETKKVRGPFHANHFKLWQSGEKTRKQFYTKI